jgi:hypothetical protein
MAARKTAAAQAEEQKAKSAADFKRINLNEAVDESLGEDDLWNELVAENAVPDFVIKGIRIPQPTKEQVDAWTEAVSKGSADPEQVLMSEDAYKELKHLFDNLPLSAWRNFQRRFTNHIFGLDDAETLGK